jgi:hypothetical protein
MAASDALQKVEQKLLGDMEFVDKFMSDPEGALAEHPELTDDERTALVARDEAKLVELAVDDAPGMMSGAHSQRCPT